MIVFVLLSLIRLQVRDVVRRVIDEYGMFGLLLMENAGRGCVDVLLEAGAEGPVAIVCGKGNNGGDGFVIARHLDNRGIPVRVLLMADADTLTGDARANFDILTRVGVPIEHFPAFRQTTDAERVDHALAGADWVIDALLGTGATGDPRPPVDDVIYRLNQHPASKLAIDLPSGLDCDTGEPGQPTFNADHTCTFVAMKPGLTASAGRELAGIIHVVDIGVPRKVIQNIRADS